MCWQANEFTAPHWQAPYIYNPSVRPTVLLPACMNAVQPCREPSSWLHCSVHALTLQREEGVHPRMGLLAAQVSRVGLIAASWGAGDAGTRLPDVLPVQEPPRVGLAGHGLRAPP